MTEIGEERIIAYVDGELTPLEALRFERAMESDAGLAEAVARHRRLRAAIADRFAAVEAEPVPDRLRRLIEHDDTVIPFRALPKADPIRRAGYAALAATLVAGLVVGQLLPRALPGPVTEKGGRIVADGGLARALDRQLASAQPADAGWRIGVSFRSKDGRYCRSFEGGAGAGLGCHDGDGWTVERFVAGSAVRGGGGYAQAGSSSAEISMAAQDMMAGAPLDAAMEKKARDSGWRDRP